MISLLFFRVNSWIIPRLAVHRDDPRTYTNEHKQRNRKGTLVYWRLIKEDLNAES